MQVTSYLHHNLMLMQGTYLEVLVKIRHDDVILRDVTWGQPLFYDKWFTSCRIFSFCRIFDDVIDKNADVSRKKCHFIIFCSGPIEEVLNLYQGKFGATGTKNKKMTEGGSNGPPANLHTSEKAQPL